MTKIKAAASQQTQNQLGQRQSINGTLLNDEVVQEDIDQNSTLVGRQTRSASTSGGGAHSTPLPHPTTAATSSTPSTTNLPEDIAIMEIILRFLQLLCENHNSELQNYLRVQPSNKTSYNLVCETLQFLDCICGSTTGGLGLLGLWINENNVHLINQVKANSLLS